MSLLIQAKDATPVRRHTKERAARRCRNGSRIPCAAIERACGFAF
eukprot:CAMPEP_0196730762 /NCGR_PEP_ID=MMETSP1091-20130531/10729_1 /TAXON_ID=302021 /ORGANISM="Rhodomonas sp., Strain CCMP768" /LENGTH=44 /DNA_ID= /DNA_START= /DNA_END= /DNA_ORIENTATION=